MRTAGGRIAERLCTHYCEEYGIETRIVRFHNIFGPLGTWDGGREKAPAAICRKVAMAKLAGKYEVEVAECTLPPSTRWRSRATCLFACRQGTRSEFLASAGIRLVFSSPHGHSTIY
jgi:hypothetical protein